MTEDRTTLADINYFARFSSSWFNSPSPTKIPVKTIQLASSHGMMPSAPVKLNVWFEAHNEYILRINIRADSFEYVSHEEIIIDDKFI